MKKLKCEVCGSIDIKKVSDDIFECQSCGVQYSTSDVKKLLVELTGEVKIDRSKEIENSLKRAQRFFDEEDYQKASEYYNKVLDLDPNNEIALKSLALIKDHKDAQMKKAEDEARNRSSTIKVLKHTIDPNDGVSNLLRALKNSPDIAPDIYKEIEIISVTQGYYPFSVVDKQYSGTYDGIACYRKQVPYTDYETKTDYSNKNQDGSYKKVQVAVTKYREEIERNPVSGSFLVDHFGVFSNSQKLNGMFTSIAPDKYDAELSDDVYFDEILGTELQREYFNDVILRQIEEQITIGYKTIEASLSEVQTLSEKSIGELEIFSDTSDVSWENRITDLFDSEVRTKAGEKVNSIIPGDFNEDVNYRWSERYSDTKTIYVPIQIIEYAYRGRFYLSAMVLTRENNMVYSYPCYTEVKKTQNATNKAITSTKKKGFPSGLLILYIFASSMLIVPLWMAITGDVDPAFAFGFVGFGSLPFLIPAVIWNIIWKSKKNAEVKKAVVENTAVLDNIKQNYNLELSNGAQAFFKIYTDFASIEKAVAAAKEVSTYSADISFIKGGNAFVSVSNGKATTQKSTYSAGSSNIKDTNGQELVEGYLYTVRLINSGVDKLSVCKIIREICGVGLATAKEIADTPYSVVAKKLSSTIADKLTTQLRIAGAVVKIEREM